MKQLLAVAACALALAGCKKSDEPAPEPAATTEDAGAAKAIADEVVVLERVVIEAIEPGSGRRLPTGELAEALEKQLAASDGFATGAAPPEAIGRPAILRVTITVDVLEEGPDGRPAVMAALEAEVEWLTDDDDLATRARLITHRDLKPGERADGVVAAHVTRSLPDLGDELIAREAIRRSDPAAVIVALSSPDPDRVVWALDVVADRRLAAAFEPVTELLGSEVPPVRNRAVSALVALGDQRAVAHLADRTDYRDREFIAVVIEAVSALGGEDAEEFLEFISSHHDRSIRSRATEALQRVRQRRQRPTPEP